jgi:hypothetical protein
MCCNIVHYSFLSLAQEIRVKTAKITYTPLGHIHGSLRVWSESAGGFIFSFVDKANACKYDVNSANAVDISPYNFVSSAS